MRFKHSGKGWFGSDPAVEHGRTPARHDVAVHEAEFGHFQTFGALEIWRLNVR
jgi:hypothetical protein